MSVWREGDDARTRGMSKFTTTRGGQDYADEVVIADNIPPVALPPAIKPPKIYTNRDVPAPKAPILTKKVTPEDAPITSGGSIAKGDAANKVQKQVVVPVTAIKEQSKKKALLEADQLKKMDAYLRSPHMHPRKEPHYASGTRGALSDIPAMKSLSHLGAHPVFMCVYRILKMWKGCPWKERLIALADEVMAFTRVVPDIDHLPRNLSDLVGCPMQYRAPVCAYLASIGSMMLERMESATSAAVLGKHLQGMRAMEAALARCPALTMEEFEQHVACLPVEHAQMLLNLWPDDPAVVISQIMSGLDPAAANSVTTGLHGRAGTRKPEVKSDGEVQLKDQAPELMHESDAQLNPLEISVATALAEFAEPGDEPISVHDFLGQYSRDVQMGLLDLAIADITKLATLEQISEAADLITRQLVQKDSEEKGSVPGSECTDRGLGTAGSPNANTDRCIQPPSGNASATTDAREADRPPSGLVPPVGDSTAQASDVPPPALVVPPNVQLDQPGDGESPTNCSGEDAPAGSSEPTEGSGFRMDQMDFGQRPDSEDGPGPSPSA